MTFECRNNPLQFSPTWCACPARPHDADPLTLSDVLLSFAGKVALARRPGSMAGANFSPVVHASFTSSLPASAGLLETGRCRSFWYEFVLCWRTVSPAISFTSDCLLHQQSTAISEPCLHSLKPFTVGMRAHFHVSNHAVYKCW